MPQHDLTITDTIDATISEPAGGLSTNAASRKRWARAAAGRKRARGARTPSQEAMRRKAKRKALAGVQ